MLKSLPLVIMLVTTQFSKYNLLATFGVIGVKIYFWHQRVP